MEKETYWSKFADNFDQKSLNIVGKASTEIIQNAVANQKDLGNTLELGCGCGAFSDILRFGAKHLTATDFSDEMVTATKKRLEGLDCITIEKANCFELQYPKNSFDTIFAANLLHIIPNPELALREWKKALKPDGKIIIVSLTSEGMAEEDLQGMVTRYLENFGQPSPTVQKLTVDKVKAMLSSAEYKIEQTTLIGGTTKAVFAIARHQ
ncbi:class I SAM-dependent methyltransferase [Vibrio sp. DW001]|uniref:class I SAM-dependent methyltransferase n=1 Tax=Vibrio sp. DW001 TaxID=2912315 RepID=UPI0023AEA7FF|nr:class I SAM-dependent methyltransferase [Vibrio sp. DW001]WED29580.1 class I SAM-dependent methyltransferase [Vibrio sp. DW001]